MAAVTIQLDETALGVLDALAASAERSREELLSEAVADFLALQRDQIEDIEAGLAEADRGEFVSDEEIERIVGKYAGR